MIVPLMQIKWQHKSLSVNIQPSPQISIIRNCSYWIMMVYPTEPQTTVSFSTSSYWASLVHLFMNHWKSNRMELHTSYTPPPKVCHDSWEPSNELLGSISITMSWCQHQIQPKEPASPLGGPTNTTCLAACSQPGVSLSSLSRRLMGRPLQHEQWAIRYAS